MNTPYTAGARRYDSPLTAAPRGKAAVRAWLRQRRASGLPPPSPMEVRSQLRECQLAHERLARTALAIVRQHGFDALSMVRLARHMNASRSAIYEQAGTMAALQAVVLRAYEEEFARQVLQAAREAEAGLPRLRKLFDASGAHFAGEARHCIYLMPPARLDKLPGALAACVELGKARWRNAFTQAIHEAIAAGHLAPECQPGPLAASLFKLLHALHDRAADAEPFEAVERTHARFEGALLPYRAAPPAAVASAPARARPPRQPAAFRWPDWLMSGATLTNQAE
ncbi:TetR/AcrR family transcriptional regulator [Pseudoduganella namucuonensis]|uniref:Transcriptional regulator, TetR family n=1 Tax=Pseudoduganella namucuonensis TaxID=1035707 RepID=A0A1I7IYE4_9BURK|nr:TetR/AcrR family transcriptional regulator [Pseudoduganella namucuonensis]SFU77948.1 transcriptional regulator, TetR family [Pseudoduganella namucuonensis]